MGGHWVETTIFLVFTGSMFMVAYQMRKILRDRLLDQILADLIYYFVLVKLGLYYLLPALLRGFSDYQFEREDNVLIFDLLRVYGIELASWFFWWLGLYAVLKPRKILTNSLTGTSLFAKNIKESKILVLIISFLSLIYFINSIVSFQETLSPLISSIFYEVLKGLPLYIGLTLGPLVLFCSNKHFRWYYRVIGFALTLSSILLVESRGALIYELIYCFFITWRVYQDKRSFAVILSVAVIVGVMYFSFGGLVAGRISQSASGDVGLVAAVDTEKKGTRSAIEELEWRFGASTRIGTAFLTMYDRGDAAGAMPMLNSFLGFIPRSMNPSKPHPSTVRGDDFYSSGMYLIWREVHGYDTFSMVEFPTGAHFYWEFGVLGIVVLSLLSGMYIGMCARGFSRLGILAVPLLVAVFKPWGYVDPKIWLSDAIMQVYQIILPMMLLLLLIRVARKMSSYARFGLSTRLE